MIDFWKFENLNDTMKRYVVNSALIVMVLFSIMIMFFAQFKVDNLQDQVKKVDAEISALDDEIRVLDVEWVYLTRPERIRALSDRYLQNNGYIASNQVKNKTTLQEFYTANLAKHGEDVAMNTNLSGNIQ